MLKTILGNNPVTSIIGYLLAGLTTLQTLLQAGETNYFQIGVAVLLAILGRVSADSNQTTPKS